MPIGDKHALRKIVPHYIWSWARERAIIRNHASIANFCNKLVSNFLLDMYSKGDLPLYAKTSFESDRIIWQYWGQGFENAPDIIHECIASVDHWCGDWQIIRLDDKTIDEFIELPPFLLMKKDSMSKAHFSDVLRLCLLYVYGGVWLDASVFMSAPLPSYMFHDDFFAYQRDSSETNQRYWKNVYAYYFGWSKGFRVNVLNSVLQSKQNAKLITSLCGVMLFFWKYYDEAPDYFFFQILFDVMIKGRYSEYNCMIYSDCKPHYLQQLINDPHFCIATREEILSTIPLHKLSYKNNA